MEKITTDERALLKAWREIKKRRYGCVIIELKSRGTEFLLKPIPEIKGKVEQVDQVKKS